MVPCAAIHIQHSEYAIHLKMRTDATLGVLVVVLMAKVVLANIFFMEDNATVSIN